MTVCLCEIESSPFSFFDSTFCNYCHNFLLKCKLQSEIAPCNIKPGLSLSYQESDSFLNLGISIKNRDSRSLGRVVILSGMTELSRFQSLVLLQKLYSEPAERDVSSAFLTAAGW